MSAAVLLTLVMVIPVVVGFIGGFLLGVADREHLRRLHADLDDQRTQSADARAADSFTARDRSVA